MNCEGLEELWPLPNRLGMLNNDPNCAGTCPVRNLDPVAANAEMIERMLAIFCSFQALANFVSVIQVYQPTKCLTARDIWFLPGVNIMKLSF